MASLNKVLQIGNLTRDPEVRYLPNGKAVCDIGLAINHKYKTESGEKREEVTFVDCTAWGKTAELIGQYCKKGSSLFIEGRLTTESWEDKTTGQKRSKMKVTIDAMQFLGGGKGGETREEQPQQSQQARPAQRERERTGSAPAQQEPVTGEMEEDDIPF